MVTKSSPESTQTFVVRVVRLSESAFTTPERFITVQERLVNAESTRFSPPERALMAAILSKTTQESVLTVSVRLFKFHESDCTVVVRLTKAQDKLEIFVVFVIICPESEPIFVCAEMRDQERISSELDTKEIVQERAFCARASVK